MIVSVTLTYIGGPTALLEFGGLRLLTDPTFDPAGSEYPTPVYVLRKTKGPALASESVGAVDVVLLSHDHHFDNLDRSGHSMLAAAERVVTTAAGAARLRGNAVGLSPWESVDVTGDHGRILRVTATPARHGPVDGDRGPVIGFMLAFTDEPERAVYISGDTVWYDGVAEVARRFTPDILVLFMGAARVAQVGPAHLTLTAAEAVTTARAFPHSQIVPLHYEGWAHFSESRAEIERAFADAGLAHRLHWPAAGKPMEFTLSRASLGSDATPL
jgi:L-ascorbate metabolism protein UlaG (beta-lactamase superfamily)